MIIDLIMLILIASLLFIILSSQMSHKAADAGIIRSKSMQIQRTLLALLSFRSNTTDATVAELIGEKYCGENTFDDLNKTVQGAMSLLNKPNHHFILTFCPEGDCSKPKSAVCSPEIGTCCIKTENINVARMELYLPETCSYDYAEIEIGIWPENMEVEKCE